MRLLCLFLDADEHMTAVYTFWLVMTALGAIVVQILYNEKVLKRARASEKAQGELLRQQLRDQNDNAFKYTSVKLVLALDKTFDDLAPERVQAAKDILHTGILDGHAPDLNHIDDGIDDIYDFFDTVGYFLLHNYIKADVAHEYFDHWFSHYHQFYKEFNFEQHANYRGAVWNNLGSLSRRFNDTEESQTNIYPAPPNKDDLRRFFEQESKIS